MFLLKTLGGLSLGSDGDPVPPSAAQRRRLVLLALLAAAGGRGVTRDRLAGILWPESAPERARHALDQLLYATRRDLGRDAVRATGGTVSLDGDRIRSDLAAFERAHDGGDWEGAAGLYAGPFVDGVYLDGSPEWERWAEAERERLARRYAGALERLAEARERAGDPASAVDAWRRLAAHDRFSGRVALRLMRALDAAGDRAAALRHSEVHAALLREELGLDPDPEVARLAEKLAAGRAPAPPPVGPPPEDAAPADPGPEPLQAHAVTGGAAPGPPLTPVDPAPAHAPRRFRPSRALAALAACVLLGLGSWVFEWTRRPAAAAAPASIAVLPFADMSPGRDAEYLSDGITEELIHALSQVEGLRVVARTSAFAFKGRDVDVREIGEALGVGALLEGSIRRSGERLRVTVQLVDARNGYHLWSRSYDRGMADVFSVQEEISRAVVRTLRPALLRGSPAPLVSTSTGNAAAYQLYMQGRHFWNQRTEEGLRRAIERFEQAIRLDPAYAEAYSGLSDAHNALADNGYVPPGPALEKAEAAVLKALELDGGLAEAHTSLGHLRLHRWDWAGAERDFRRSIELNPGYAVAYQYYAYLLTFHGRFEESLPLIRRAQHLDPLSPAIQSNVGQILLLARRYPEAAEQVRFALQMDSTRVDTRHLLASTLVELGRHEEAVSELRRVIAQSGGWHRSAVATLGHTYARAGRREDAERVRGEIERARREGKTVTPFDYAAMLGALGRRDEAFAALDEAFVRQASGLVTIAVSPSMDPLRSDPRFAVLLRRLGLPRPAEPHPGAPPPPQEAGAP